MIENWNNPRHQCLSYFFNQQKEGILLSKEEFDSNLDNFIDGPHRDSFGTGYGEPYYPWTQAFGILKDGKAVFCELYEGYK